MYSVFEYYSNNILFVFVFGHNSESEYYSYSYSAKYLCMNIFRIHIRSLWGNEYYSYLYSVKILILNIIRIRIRSKKQYSLISDVKYLFFCFFYCFCWHLSTILDHKMKIEMWQREQGTRRGNKAQIHSRVYCIRRLHTH